MKKNILDPVTFDEIQHRIQLLTPESKKVWGTLTVEEMVCHCKMPLKNALRITNSIREAGALKSGLFRFACVYVIKQFPHHAPTGKDYNVSQSNVLVANLEKERKELLSLLQQFQHAAVGGNYGVHPLFGAMSNKEWGIITYMHLDHHLRQFSV